MKENSIRERSLDICANEPASHIDKLTRSKLSLCVAMACGLMGGASPALSQQSSQAEATVFEEIIVTGTRQATENALNRQRQADGLVSALSTDDIGNFPDQNVAEAARRLPGISVENDQGEGRFVTIRGVDSNLSSTTINGFSVPSPQRDGRQVALDVIPSDLVSAIVITKLPTAEMDGDAVGGSVDIETVSPLRATDDFWLTSRLEAGYADLTGDSNPKASVAFSKKSDDGRFGVAGAISWAERDFGSDNIEIDGAYRADNSPKEPEFRDYTVTRERLGAALNFDFQLDDNTLLYARTLYSDFDDFEARQRTEFAIRDADAVSVVNGVTIVTDGLRVDRDQRARRQRQKVVSVQAGVDKSWDEWGMDFAVSYSLAQEDETDRLSTEFRQSFGRDDFSDFSFIYDPSNRENPLITGGNPTSQALLQNASLFEFDGLEFEDNHTEDEELAFKVDFEKALTVAQKPSTLKFGAKVRLRDKSNDQALFAPDDLPTKADGSDYTAADFAQNNEYSLGDFGPAINESTSRAAFASIAANGDLDEFESFSPDYEASEDVYAAFAQLQVELENGRITGGLRVERTEFDSSGFLVGDDIVAINDSNEYTNLLPSLSGVFNLSEDTILRAGYARTISRPLINSAVTRIAIDDEDASIGNAQLEPFAANNLDVSLEYYFDRFSVVSAGVFYKDIDDYIINTNIFGTPAFNRFSDNPLFAEVTSAEQAQNAGSATLLGLELNAQHAFDNLPAPFDGLIAAVNYTYTDGDADLDDGTTIPLPKLSKNLASASIAYEKDKLSLRLAAAYRGRYLDELNSEGFADRYVENHLQFDITARYDVSDNLQLYAEWINIGDEPFYATFDSKQFLAQYETYGWSAAIGIKYNY